MVQQGAREIGKLFFTVCASDLSFSFGKTGKYALDARPTAEMTFVNNLLTLASVRLNTFYATLF